MLTDETYRGVLRWISLIGTIGGLVGLVIFNPLVWLLTGRVSIELLGSFGTLFTGGLGTGLVREITTRRVQLEDSEPPPEPKP